MKNTQFKDLILGLVVLFSFVGLIGFALVDQANVPAFQQVAHTCIAAFLGYLIPNGK
jgi:hypothetical protein